MAEIKEVKVPDIGGYAGVDVIEVLVKPGDIVNKEQSLIVLESDKSTIEVPSNVTGVIKEIKVSVKDKVSEGSLIALVETEDATSKEQPKQPEVQKEDKPQEKATTKQPEVAAKTTSGPVEKTIAVPDLGGVSNVDVIEVNIKVGDDIVKDQPLITLEGEKASMEIPAPFAGKIKSVSVKVGDKVSEKDAIAIVDAIESEVNNDKVVQPEVAEPKASPVAKQSESKQPDQPVAIASFSNKIVYAGPAVRRFARELGVDLTQVKGSGEKGRIQKQDVQAYVKQQLQSKQTGGGFNLAPMPEVDFAKFGEIEIKPLTKINKISGANLHRNWVQVPHITQFDEADITELEEFRKTEKHLAEAQGFKLTPLVFIMKAVVSCLKAYPRFNSSLDKSGENLVLKKYYHLGVAVDTPNGLVVAVIRDVDQKGFFDLAKELGQISEKARTKGLTPAEMQGSCFTISSLGGIGGTAFTPIVNVPDVAILGVSKSSIKPVYKDGEFVPRLMLPLSLSYDHRVIDGAEGARFSNHLVTVLSDIRNLLL